jgi:hypothetical protein
MAQRRHRDVFASAIGRCGSTPIKRSNWPVSQPTFDLSPSKTRKPRLSHRKPLRQALRARLRSYCPSGRRTTRVAPAA